MAIIPWMTVYEAMVFMFLLFGVSRGLLDTSKILYHAEFILDKHMDSYGFPL